LEKEARCIWQKYLVNPTPTNKELNCRVFYMRNESLYKKSGMEEQIKRDQRKRKTDSRIRPTA
jgi:hypothetical protein